MNMKLFAALIVGAIVGAPAHAGGWISGKILKEIASVRKPPPEIGRASCRERV